MRFVKLKIPQTGLPLEKLRLVSPPPHRHCERVPERDSAKAGGGLIGRASGIPHLTPALSAPEGGEGVNASPVLNRHAGAGLGEGAIGHDVALWVEV